MAATFTKLIFLLAFRATLIHNSALNAAHESTLFPGGSSAGKDSCSARDAKGNEACTTSAAKDELLVRLVQREGVKAGYTQNLELVDGQVHQLITRSLKPLLFEIPNFLTADECDQIINVARTQTLTESQVIPNGDSMDSKEDFTTEEISKECLTMINNYDIDQDKKISVAEFISYFYNTSESTLEDTDVRIMFEDYFDHNGDGFVLLSECLRTNATAVDQYVTNIEEGHPLKRSRYSDQTWLSVTDITDPVLQSIQQRLAKLTQLPLDLLQRSEALQVVRYSVHGHFHAHYDSSLDGNVSKPCCAFATWGREVVDSCHLCRFMTVLYYLNDVDVDNGGETAFPVADNATFNQKAYDDLGLDNLSLRCNQSNIVVRPSKGTALMWYNHFMDRQTGQIGPMDLYSLHGGCDVRKGVKWIANNWINVPHMFKPVL